MERSVQVVITILRLPGPKAHQKRNTASAARSRASGPNRNKKRNAANRTRIALANEIVCTAMLVLGFSYGGTLR
jgi:hypothetical protein